MDAAAYLTQLIAHLVAGMHEGDDTDVSSVLHTVEGAASALAAAGLLDAGGVQRFNERALDALEASGAIQQISFSSSASFSAAALGSQGRPPRPRPPGDVPALTGVVPIARTVPLADGGELALLSLNRWTTGFDVLFATVGQDLSLGDDGPLGWDWSLTDDRGMRYAVRRGGGGGGGTIQWQRVHAVPALPAEARHLSLSAIRDGTQLCSVTVDLEGTVAP